MGYNSNFSGSYAFKTKLTKQQEDDLRAFIDETFGKDCSDIWYNDGEQYWPDECDGSRLYPACYEMHAYDFGKNLLTIVTWCREHGYPSLTGEVERIGEEYGDYEKISTVNARVYVSDGKVVYGDKHEVKGE